ncbi:Inorganic phosphate transporter 1-2 [Golovinomyces cichoracearum]|uniref:Inorganic phosphate transporter 1-2 n=1 Tax=Golovinomyces cichoracearum TaxID=62708 RepID=A0A420H7M2_9PEZI|nr:Inorganic phosphate transporter 1-2 [Golovinomyces cichoracearum]
MALEQDMEVKGLSLAEKKEEDRIFDHLLYPDDLFTPDGTYWADLPKLKQISFVNHKNNEEAKKEFASFWQMFKKDPLSPVSWYFQNAVLPGAGLGLEGYVLFSIGNLSPFFKTMWPQCWKTHEVCSENWIHAVTYLEVLGIIVGQILVGIMGDMDRVGRRWGLIQDAAMMFLGLLMLTASWGATLNSWVIFYAFSLFFYGIGVGGEYPMTATAAMENSTAGRVSDREDRLHRGRNVTMAFLMQGWGQFFNVGILIISLLIFHGGGTVPYSLQSAQWTFRVSFAIPAVGTLWLVYYRWFKMPLASKELAALRTNSNVTGYDIQSLKMTFRHFGGRIIGTAGTWFCNDVFFYGNKLFQSAFIQVIEPDALKSGDVITGWKWSLVNVSVSMIGYYLGSMLIDNKLYGRKWMQQVGFLMCFILFVVPAFRYDHYRSIEHIKEFQVMFFLSSFFNQCGPNSVTFLIAAEVYPETVRASAHGFSAAIGKSGALLASILYNYIDDQTKFYVVPWFGLVGMILTWIFVPDTTGLDLKEQERRWEFIRAGKESDYHGIAVHSNHLSLWERIRGIGKSYDPKLDRLNRIEEMRERWEKMEQEKSGREDGLADNEDEFSEPIKALFRKNRRASNTNSDEIPKEKNANLS